MSPLAVELASGVLEARVLRECAAGRVRGTIGADAQRRIAAGADAVARLLEDGQPVYGINTGFGKLAQTRIAPDQLARLQRNIVLSHSAGVGPLIEPEVVRLILLLKAASLAQGFSGVRPGTVQALLALLNADILPAIPAKGSVGASGDLAPLAHLAAVLIGEGEVLAQPAPIPGAQALRGHGLEALVLGPKEGLALLNGTQVSTAFALWSWLRLERVFAAAIGAGALTLDAACGSDAPFDDRIQVLRNQPGQRSVAGMFRALIEHSPLRASHQHCEKVQDPYCLRCQPQVMGACLDQIRHAAGILVAEANGVSDNPLVFADTGEVLSGGNFHAEPVAFAADNLALAICEIGSLAERRIAMLMDPALSGLPAFLTHDGGVNSGFMLAQVTAAALVSENKALAFPTSADSIPTSANQEDHVSMATHGARRLATMVENCAAVIAVEWLCAAQALEFRRPLRSSARLESLHAALRRAVPAMDGDRALAPDIAAVSRLVLDGTLSCRDEPGWTLAAAPENQDPAPAAGAGRTA